MKIFFITTKQLGSAKTFLVKQVLTTAAKQRGDEVVEQAQQADLVIALGGLPYAPELQGKRVFSVEAETAFNAPEKTLEQAIIEAAEYVAPLEQSAVEISADFPTKQKIL